ncbi:MAG: hypothetical protein GYB21_09000 [Oceanospirillales bacterium]|nr:hypothetical protein [Oceanospirillales bacterium]
MSVSNHHPGSSSAGKPAPSDDLTLDRTVVKQSPVRDTQYHYDARLKQVTVAESDLEADRILQLMFDPDVATYKAQSFSCYPFKDAPSRRYTLDNEVVMTTGEIFEEEVKPKSRTTSPAFVEKHRIIAEYAEAERGAQHRIITEDHIYTGALIDNLLYLLTRKRSACPRAEALAFRTASQIGKTSVREAQQIARNHGFNPDIVARCVAHRLLPCDLTIDWPEIILDFAVIQ